ncbi:MAG: HDIG domain-containing metalloprotein [Glaciecola sp.]|jgi:3'-5' exoribonuclease
MSKQSTQIKLENAYNYARFKGTYYLVGFVARIDSFGMPYWEITLSDASGHIKVYCRDESCIYSEFTPQSLVEVEVRTEMTGLHPHFRCKYIELSSKAPEQLGTLSILPSSLCSIPGAVQMLCHLAASIQTRYLKEFLHEVLLQTEVGIRFIQCPASLRYHHSYQGGLLAHSLEVATAFCQNNTLKQIDRDIGIVAALLHDIGKTQTLTPGQNRTAIGRLVDHDQLTLQICSSALETLSNKHNGVANHLCHIWTCESDGSRYGFKAKTHIARLLRTYDHASAFSEKATAC